MLANHRDVLLSEEDYCSDFNGSQLGFCSFYTRQSRRGDDLCYQTNRQGRICRTGLLRSQCFANRQGLT